jgi:peptidoglycan/LPS O-acetylase OafA/YrhL
VGDVERLAVRAAEPRPDLGSVSCVPQVELATRRPHIPALDGVRALAVLAVLTSHAWGSIIPGGWAGVDVFFVLSGYLITSILLDEHRRTGAVSVARFYARRALRLLPALGATIALALVVAATLRPDLAAGTDQQAVAATAYVANWWETAHQGAPGLLLHTWSLSVEEQFYLAWPLLLCAALAIGGRRAALGVAVAGACALTVHIMLGVGTNPYYRTDTRGVGLLIGAVLAVALSMTSAQRFGQHASATARPDLASHHETDGPQGRARPGDGGVRADPRPRGDHPARRGAGDGELHQRPLQQHLGRTPERVGRLIRDAGLIGAGVLVIVALAVSVVDGMRGIGLPVIGVATAAVILELVVHPAGMLAWGLSWRPLRWVGERSYGIYLYHAVILDGLHMAPGPALLAIGAPLSLAVAALSFRYLERPFLRLKERRVAARTEVVAVAA